MESLTDFLDRPARVVLGRIVANDTLRRVGLEYARRMLFKKIVENPGWATRQIRHEQYRALINLLSGIDTALSKQLISRSARRKLLEVFIGEVLLREDKARERFSRQHGRQAPGFIAVSPESRCNLSCDGCYAASSAGSLEHLGFEIVDRIIAEKTLLWGSHFTVVSGGEPLLWKPDGGTISDICRKHQDNYFLIFTNGTLIDSETAGQLADLGNITACISVEGFEEETDRRRGRGSFKRILGAIDELRAAGVPFGISVTATKDNVDRVLSDAFADFFFEEMGAIYGWIFQYMPMGRHARLELMVTPSQRKWMFDREQYFLHEKGVFYVDFWNGGLLSNGCVAAARSGGYLHIDWNGNVTPCVFFPYAVDNIKSVYARGGDLNDVIESDFFESIREWQYDYGYGKLNADVKNWIAPCCIRDHYEVAYRAIAQSHARPVDDPAARSLADPLYYKGLVEYGDAFESLSDPIWRKVYLGSFQ